MDQLRGLDPWLLVPLVGGVVFLWGLAKRTQPLIWLGLAAVLALPAVALANWVLSGGLDLPDVLP
jgi:hypothetical protein